MEKKLKSPNIAQMYLGLYCVLITLLLHFSFPYEWLNYGRIPVLMAISFLSGYPVFGRGRRSEWNLIGDWTLYKWIGSTILLFMFLLIIEVTLKTVI